jgi:hypothetical protein
MHLVIFFDNSQSSSIIIIVAVFVAVGILSGSPESTSWNASVPSLIASSISR